MLVHGTQEHVEALREEIAEVLAPMGLRLSAAKTRVVHMSDGFDFPGFRIQWKRKRHGWANCRLIRYADRRIMPPWPGLRWSAGVGGPVRAA